MRKPINQPSDARPPARKGGESIPSVRSGASVRKVFTKISGYVGTSLSWDATISVILVGAGFIVSYLVQIAVARTVGLEEYGRYIYAFSILNFLILIVGMDLGSAAQRFCRIYIEGGQWPLWRGFILSSRRLVFLSASAATVLGWLAVEFLGQDLEPRLSATLQASCTMILPSALLTLELNLMLSLGRVFAARVPFYLIRPATFGALFFAAVLAGVASTAVTAVFANAAATVITICVSILIWKRVRPVAPRQAAPAFLTGQWLQFACVSLGSNIMSTIASHQSGIIIVGSFVGVSAAGLYSAATQIVSLSALSVNTVNKFSLPFIAQLYHLGRHDELHALLRRMMIVNWLFFAPAIVVILVGGHLLLATFGPGFEAAYPILVVLAIGSAVSALWGGLWADTLMMTGYQKRGAALVMGSAIFSLALTMVLTPRYGVLGTAAATTLVTVTRDVIAIFLVRQALGFWPWGILRSN